MMKDIAENKRNYWCFISYSHADNAESGREWASWLQHSLEAYRIPEDIVGSENNRGHRIPERIFPVFRDEEELAGGHLQEAITEALESSKALIVICSPRTHQSTYVDQGRSEKSSAIELLELV